MCLYVDMYEYKLILDWGVCRRFALLYGKLSSKIAEMIAVCARIHKQKGE